MIEQKLKEGFYIKFETISSFNSKYLYKIKNIIWIDGQEWRVILTERPTGVEKYILVDNLKEVLKTGLAKIYPDSINYMKQRRAELNAPRKS